MIFPLWRVKIDFWVNKIDLDRILASFLGFYSVIVVMTVLKLWVV